MNMTRSLRALMRGLAVGVPLVLAGAASAQTTLKLIPQADLKILDPIWSSANITLNHANMIYETLFALDSKFDAKPQMLEGYKVSDDALTYTFTLCPGLKWEDGKPVTSADVVQSLKRWAVRMVSGMTLMQHVAEVAVTGVPDPEWGAVVTAWVVASDATRPPSLDELRDHVRVTLPAFCAPRRMEVVDMLPRTALGKIQRHRLARD